MLKWVIVKEIRKALRLIKFPFIGLNIIPRRAAEWQSMHIRL